MPCDQVALMSLDLRVANQGILRTAAQKLGIEVVNKHLLRLESGRTIRLDGEKAICNPRDQSLVNQLRVEYARETVKYVAGKLGWKQVQKGNGKLTFKKGV